MSVWPVKHLKIGLPVYWKDSHLNWIWATPQVGPPPITGEQGFVSPKKELRGRHLEEFCLFVVFCFVLVGLGFALRASHLQSRSSTA
jgi:hypothetical protein